MSLAGTLSASHKKFADLLREHIANLQSIVPKVQTRGVKTLDFAGTKEEVYERGDWPREKFQEYFKNDTLALIGYGSQGSILTGQF